MVSKTLVLLATTWLAQLAVAVSLAPLSKGGCILLNKNKLYCLGGVSGTTYSNQVFGLDLSKDYADLTTLNNAWTALAPMTEANSEFAMVPSGDNGIFINGGSGSNTGKPLQYQSAIYNTLTNTWYNIVAANATNSLAQAKGAVATSDTSSTGDAAYIWGGVMDQTIGSVNTSYSGTFLVMNPLTGAWNPSIVGGTYSSSYTPRIGHTMVNSYNMISVFGGQQATYNTASNTYQLSPASFSTVPQFNMILLKWSLATATGDVPSPRSYHSTTVASIYTLVLYGGATPGTNTPVTDTLYSANILGGSIKWTRLPDSAGSPGPRFGHASVTYSYNTVLVIGGVDGSGSAKNDVNVYTYTSNTWRSSFSSTGFYSNTTTPGSNGGSSSGPNGSGNIAYGSGSGSLALQQGIAGGIGAGGLVVFGLIGLALGMVIKKSHQANQAAGINHHPMDNMIQGNGYAKVELVSSSDDRPLPPAPGFQQPAGEAASYLQHHPSTTPTNYHQPHPY